MLEFRIRDPSGRTLLHYFAKNRQIDLTRFLIRQGADVDAQDNDGMTPLMLAVLNCDDDTIRILLNAEANVFIVNRLGQNVLQMAFTAKVTERRILLELLRCVQNNSCTTEQIALRLIDAKCPIYHAVILRDTAVVQEMLDLGVDVDAKNSHKGSTALFQAVMECDPKMVKLLLEYKANVNAEDTNGYTAVSSLHSCKCDCEQCFGRLREKLEVLRILIHGGASLTSFSSGRLFQACSVLQRGSREAVGIVLRSNVDFAARDPDGYSILDYIVHNKNEDVVEELKPHIHKFDVNAFDALGKCPLLRAAECGNLRAVKLLLDNGAEVNCVEEGTGATPLFKCFVPTANRDEGRIDECIELLLEYGADPQVRSNYENAPTIFDMARKTKRFKRTKLVIARLAMMVGEGVPLIEMVRLKLEECDLYRSYFGSCRLVLRERYGSADLFGLLTANESVLMASLIETECLRKLISLSEDEKMKKSHVLYYNMLKKRIAKVLGTVRYDSCDCALPWTVDSKLDIKKMLEMKKVLAKHLRCVDCLRNLLRVCYSTEGISREVILRRRIATTIRRTDLQDRAAVVIGMIFGGRLTRCHIVMNEILGYLDDESLEVLSCV